MLLDPFEAFSREQHVRSSIRELDDYLRIVKVMQNSILHGELHMSACLQVYR